MKPESQEKEEPIKIQEAVDARIDKVSSLSFSLSIYILPLYAHDLSFEWKLVRISFVEETNQA